jgi:hypothetical protein
MSGETIAKMIGEPTVKTNVLPAVDQAAAARPPSLPSTSMTATPSDCRVTR